MSDGATVSDVATPTAALPRVGRLLRIVHRLVAYGTNLLATLKQGTSSHDNFMAAFHFGTRDLALILARITCGLQRAAGLEARLNAYVVRGVDVPLPRLGCVRAAAAGPSGDAPVRAPRNPVLTLLPSAAEIAEQVRTRSIGAVIGDICRDFGLEAGLMEATLREELFAAAMECGLDLTGFIANSCKPVFGKFSLELTLALSGWQETEPFTLIAVPLAPVTAQPP